MRRGDPGVSHGGGGWRWCSNGLNPPRGDRASGWIWWKDCGKAFLFGGKKPKSLGVVVGGSSRSRTAALCVRRRPGDRAWATRVWIRIPRGAIRVARARRGRKASRARTLGRGAAAGGRQRAEPAVWVGVAFGPEGRTAGPPRRGCCSRRRRVDAASRARARRAPSRASRQRPVNRSRGLGRSPPPTLFLGALGNP